MKAEPFEVVGPMATTYLVERVRLVRDAQAAWCPTCESVLFSQYWAASKSKWMHERGTGHKVWLVALAEPVAS